MNSAQNLCMISSYLKWANGVFFEAVSNLSESERNQKRPMLFDNILSLLNHVFAMQIVWKGHLEGSSHNLQSRRASNNLPFNELWEMQSDLDDWYLTYANRLTESECAELVNFTFIGGGEGSMTRYEIFHHVVNHASYHRGHIEGVFYQMSIEPPSTDLPVFLRDVSRP